VLQEQEPLATDEEGQEEKSLTTDRTGSSNMNLQPKMLISVLRMSVSIPNVAKMKGSHKRERYSDH
jgi:hypothetical protein